MVRTVVITGASSGIGYETALYFAKKGWNVAATSRAIDNKLFKNFKTIKVFTMDVDNAESIDTAFTQILDTFRDIHVIINNAGYGLDGAFEAFTDEQIEKQFRTNVFGLMKVTRKAIEYFRPTRKGTIIQIASMGGRLTFPLYSVYHASKWAVEGFTESLQYELRQFNIRLRIIEPGVIKTAFYGDSRKFAHPKKELGYRNFVSDIEAQAAKAGKAGDDPKKVARVIFKAATSSSKRLRYPVGKPAPLLLWLKKYLPDRLFFFIIRKNFSIK